MKRILCPIDFSEASYSATQYAGNLARKIKAGITLINVQVLGEMSLEQVVYRKDMNTQAHDSQLEELSVAVTKAFKVPCGFEVASSRMSFASVIASNSLDYDLIVIGTKASHSTFQEAFGTHAYKVAREAKVPILIVPEECSYGEIKTIVYAYDYWRTTQLPFNALLRFAKSLHSKIVILQAMEESDSKTADEELKQDQKEIKDFFGDEGVDIRFDTIHTSDIATGINNYMHFNGDVLAVYAEPRSLIQKLFHKSVIKEISNKASYPVFVF
ncbi:MAG TPA: universal stress protein [Cyclobacteriaceae bacterium]|nr:universal stress protein [Cyclobacteriaceae bacterium]